MDSAFGLSRLIAGVLVGTSATDPASWILGLLGLVVTVLAGCRVPARRVLRSDPWLVLRAE